MSGRREADDSASMPEQNGRPEGVSRRDLLNAPFPEGVRSDEGVTSASLAAVRSWAQREAQEAIWWYLRDKRVKRRSSRILRAAALLLATVGGGVPLLHSIYTHISVEWGYVGLAAAAGCLAYDHFFGLSNGWSRDIRTAQELQRRLTEFDLDWLALEAATESPTAAVEARISLARSFVLGVRDVMRAETEEWAIDFDTKTTELRSRSQLQSAPADGRGTSRTDSRGRAPGEPDAQ